MNDMFSQLSQKEMEFLGQFLLDRVEEDAVTDDMDEGILEFTELDGFFTAIVSGPVMIPPSRWLPGVWGDFEPVWDQAEDMQRIMSIMMRHMNGIAATLMEHPGDFEPIFLERTVEGKAYAIVDEWCEGYRRGVSLAAEQWSEGGREVEKLLIPIMAFTAETDWQGHENSVSGVEIIQQKIAPNVQKLHAYWLERREDYTPPATTPMRRAEPRVGRNDPCPCGSGKKYKKCCLH